MTLTEKAAYLKGLAEGLSLASDKPETKIISAIIDLLDDVSLSVSDLEDEVALVGEQLDAVDEDLDSLESYIFDDEDDCCDCDCCDDDEYYEVECPSCGEVINIDGGVLEEGSIECPNCGENLEFDIEFEDDDEESDD